MRPLFFCKPKSLGNWAVGPLMLGALYATHSVAWAQTPVAGQWYITRQIEKGKAVANEGDADSTFVFDFAKGNYGAYEGAHANGNLPNNGNAYVQSGGGGGTISVSGPNASAKIDDLVVKVTYKWGRAAAGPPALNEQLAPPPPKIGFWISGGMDARASGGTQDVSASVGGHSTPENSKSYKYVGDKQLFSFDTEGETEFVGTMPIKGSAKGDSSASLQFGFDSNTDDRSFSISSSTIEPSYYKSFDPPNGNLAGPFSPHPRLHPVNRDGSKDTSSVVRFYDGLWQTGAIRLNANTAGNWTNPYFEWSVAGESNPATDFSLVDLKQEHQSSLTTGFSLGDGKSLPKNSFIYATVTDDKDKVVGKNYIEVMWHLPYEKTRDLPDGSKRKEISWVGQTHIGIERGVGVATTPARTLDPKAAVNGVLVLAELGGVPGASELGKVFELVTGFSEWQTTEPSYNISTDELKNDPAMFKQVLLADPDNIEGLTLEMRTSLLQKTNDELRPFMTKYACFVGRVRFHKQKSYLADKYGSHGYVDSDNVFTHDYTYPNGKEFQLFYRLGKESPPPSEGDYEIPPSFNVS